jgi:nucleotide-binding universal stress UspA family protein
MSIFPTKILLATDGSTEAQLAATTASDLAEKTNSELHVVTVGPADPLYEWSDSPPTSSARAAGQEGTGVRGDC